MCRLAPSMLVGILGGILAMTYLNSRGDPVFGPVGTYIPGAEAGTMPVDDFEPYSVHREPFACGGETCEGWLYFPREVGMDDPPVPVVVMGHGLGLQKDCNLERLIHRFVLHRMAVLIFDYRSFGGSGGVPRHVINPFRQLEDWEAAVAYAASGALGQQVNASAVAVFGYSFGGGHAAVVGSKWSPVADKVTAVISAVPYLDPLETLLHRLKISYESGGGLAGFAALARLAALSVQDCVRAVLGLPPLYIPIAGYPGEVAALAAPDSIDYLLLVPDKPLGGWQNQVAARVMMYTMAYRPMSYVAGIEKPWLVLSALHDTLCPAEVVRSAVARAPEGMAELMEFDAAHFEFYPAVDADLSHRVGVEVAAWACEKLSCLGPTPRAERVLFGPNAGEPVPAEGEGTGAGEDGAGAAEDVGVGMAGRGGDKTEL